MRSLYLNFQEDEINECATLLIHSKGFGYESNPIWKYRFCSSALVTGKITYVAIPISFLAQDGRNLIRLVCKICVPSNQNLNYCSDSTSNPGFDPFI